jgi:iron complex transport system ATP-binding protein
MRVDAKDVNITLGKNHILKGIEMLAKTNEFVGVIGPNGSGKSTFLKCIYRVLKPASGIIRINDINIQSLSIRENAKKFAVVSQHNYYNFDFLVRDIVLMGRAPHKKMMERDTKEDFDIVDEALEKVGMTPYADRIFSTLSGGEQQRIILARALAQKTNCLLLDEPTNHLDIKHQFKLLNVVKQLGVSVVAVFHDLNITAMYCDKIYAIDDGKVVAMGTPEKVLTKKLIKDLYEVDADIAKDEFGRINIIFYPLKNSCVK